MINKGILIDRQFDAELFADNLRLLREGKGLTQAELGSLCGISENAIRNYELGRCFPKITTLNALADALDVSVGSICIYLFDNDLELQAGLRQICQVYGLGLAYLGEQREDVAFDCLVVEGHQAALPLIHFDNMIAAIFASVISALSSVPSSHLNVSFPSMIFILAPFGSFLCTTLSPFGRFPAILLDPFASERSLHEMLDSESQGQCQHDQDGKVLRIVQDALGKVHHEVHLRAA